MVGRRQETVQDPRASEELRRVIDVLDALQARDADRLQRGLDFLHDQKSVVLSDGMTTIAGMIALELKNAPPEARQRYVDAYMDNIAKDGLSSENLAYLALRAYANR